MNAAFRPALATGALRTVDVEFAATLKRLDPQTPDSVQLAAALAMRAVSAGHSGFELATAARMFPEVAAALPFPSLDAWTAELRNSHWVALSAAADAPALLVLEHGRLALRRYARYEQMLADQLRLRAAQADAAIDEDWLRIRLQALFGAAHAQDRQALACTVALRRWLALITGGPGTGKSSTVARLLVLLHALAQARGEDPPRILLAAPTGRAASRLGEAIAATLEADVAGGRVDPDLASSIPREAQTLHRLLGLRSIGRGVRFDAQHPLPCDALIVDEASMVDLPLMARLLAATPMSARLILLGDPDQLPAVEAGDVLGALCLAAGDGVAPTDATADLGVGVDVDVDGDTAAPLAQARVRLLRGHRQADASGLAELAAAVREGDMSDTVRRLRASTGTDPLQARLFDVDAPLAMRHGSPRELETALRRFALPTFEAIAAAPDPATALQRAAGMRILCALRDGPFGAQHWNAWCARELGDRPPASDGMFHGALLMVTANDARLGLFNGDIGVVWRGPDADLQVWFQHGGELRARRPSQLPAHAHAYASTVHKAQGSEFERVVLVLPDRDARVLSRELVYTAITRARRGVLLWAPEDVLRLALARRLQRDSGLLTRLRDE